MLPYDNSPEAMEEVAQMMEEEVEYYEQLNQQKLQDPEYVKMLERLAKENPDNPFAQYLPKKTNK